MRQWVVITLLLLVSRSSPQLSKPIVSDRQIDVSKNKFLQRSNDRDDAVQMAKYVQHARSLIPPLEI